MKIEGSEKELRNLFKEKKEFKWPKFKFWKKLSSDEKSKIFTVLIISMVLIFMFIVIITVKDISDDYITSSQCDLVTKNIVNVALEGQETNPIYGILYVYYDLIRWLIIAIGIGWVLHGVGFHIIKR